MVGSRRASQYGMDACRELIKGLRGRDIAIVSGLALGIDAEAHKAAMEAGLETVAVLASGLGWDAIYPRNNLRLAKEIVASGGALISEFPPAYGPRRFNFPERNRIMAGLSHATLVVEAELKSGTLITARLALDYNRDVLAVPGSIFSEHTRGPHMLISNGAATISKSDDIIRELGLESNSADSMSSTGSAGSIGFAGGRKKTALDDCTGIEKKVYKALSEPLSRNKVAQKVGGDARETNVALSLLEMKGFIVESGGELRRA